MTCNTSLREDNRSLNSSDKGEQLSDRTGVRETNDENLVELGKTAADPECQEGNFHEQGLQDALRGQPPMMLVSLQVPRREVDETNESQRLERKSLAQKELNSVQRRKQIADYNSLKLKEERQRRYRIRRGDELSFLYGKYDAHSVTRSNDDDTPPSKRKKRVSFEF